MVELCRELGLDLVEVMRAKPVVIDARAERDYDELLLIEDYAV